MPRPDRDLARPDDVARRVSLWACLLLALVMMLGGHSPPCSTHGPMVLPDSRDIHWSADGGVPALTREARAFAPFKLPSGSQPPALAPGARTAIAPVAALPANSAALPDLGPAPGRHDKPPATGPPIA